MGKGSSAPAAQTVTSTTSNLPDYAQPFYTGMLNTAQAYTSPASNPYTPYGGQRQADFNPAQQAVQNATMGLTTPGQISTASDIAAQAGLGSLNAGYTPSSFSAQQVGAPGLNYFTMDAPGAVQGGMYNSPQMRGLPSVNAGNVAAQTMSGAQTQWTPDLHAYGMGYTRDVNPNFISSPTMQGASTSYGSGPLEQFRMAAPEQFGQAQADRYMSPYMQSVVDVQRREAINDAQQTQLMQNLGAARQGTYGGSRQLLAGIERERNLGQRLGDIEATGLQSAYENAQQQFERDRTAGMTTGQTNLNAALQQQQLGVNTGLQAALANLSNEQQARVNNQASQLQVAGMNQEQAMRAALANQGVDVTRAQANQQAQLQTQDLGTRTGLEAALANLSNQQQAQVNNQATQLQAAGMNQDAALRAALANQQTGFQTGQQNLAAKLQTQGLNADQAMQAALANQNMGFQTGQQNLASLNQTQQLGAQTGLQALLANQSSDLEAQRLAEQSRQFGAQQGLAGLGQAGQLAQTLGNMGQLQQNSDLALLNAQKGVGDSMQAAQQQQLDTQYADFLRQRDYPLEQLSYYNALLRGLPLQLNSTQTTYAPPPSAASQILGTGLGALGMYNTLQG